MNRLVVDIRKSYSPKLLRDLKCHAINVIRADDRQSWRCVGSCFGLQIVHVFQTVANVYSISLRPLVRNKKYGIIAKYF